MANYRDQNHGNFATHSFIPHTQSVRAKDHVSEFGRHDFPAVWEGIRVWFGTNIRHTPIRNLKLSPV